MRPIFRSRRAEADLLAIWISIAVADMPAADRVLDSIEQSWRRLERYPFSGVAREDIEDGIRHVVCGRYFTFYRVTDQAIEIARVIHGHRQIESADLGMRG